MLNEISMLWPTEIRRSEMIYNEKGVSEKIYGIEYDSKNKRYISTIEISDRNFEKLKTYKIEGDDLILIAELKRLIPKNLEKATISNIEEEIGLNDLASQLN